MARSTPLTLALPPFAGATRRLVLWNLAAFFFIAVLDWIAPGFSMLLLRHLALEPLLLAHGEIWQAVTYAFLNFGILSTAFALLSLWFFGSLLEAERGPRWLLELYFVSIAGGASIASVLAFTHVLHLVPTDVGMGVYAGLFGLLVAIGLLMGDVEFLLLFVVRIKAKYMVAIFILVDLATLLKSAQTFNALLHLSAGLAGLLYLRFVPRRGLAFGATERYFALRNAYYRSRRRRAASKFKVYMRKQNREVHFDQDGRYIDPEQENPNDRKWMN